MFMPEIQQWAARQAVELRMAQGALGKHRQQREEYLLAHLRQALQGIPSGEKQEHLQALALYFPDFQETRTVVEKITVEKEADLDQAAPEALLEAFIQKAQEMSLEKRQEFARRLAAAGIALPKAQPESQPSHAEPPAPVYATGSGS